MKLDLIQGLRDQKESLPGGSVDLEHLLVTRHASINILLDARVWIEIVVIRVRDELTSLRAPERGSKQGLGNRLSRWHRPLLI